MEPASVWRRVFACALDLAAITILYSFILLLFRLSGSRYSGGFFFSVLVMGSYYAALEGNYGGTLGKQLFKMRVTGTSGASPTYREVWIRTLCRFIPFDPVSIFFSPFGLAWHDHLSNTRVVTLKRWDASGTPAVFDTADAEDTAGSDDAEADPHTEDDPVVHPEDPDDHDDSALPLAVARAEATTETRFYVSQGLSTLGPFTAEQLGAAIRRGQVSRSSAARVEGTLEWKTVADMLP